MPGFPFITVLLHFTPGCVDVKNNMDPSYIINLLGYILCSFGVAKICHDSVNIAGNKIASFYKGV
jgi:hypothetical protein